MYQTLKNISGKKKIYRSRIEDVMHENTLLYCRAMYELYDLGFILSPFYVNEIDLRIAIQEEFEDELFLLRSPLDGKVMYTEKTLRFTELATKNEEFKKVIQLYKVLLESERKLRICDTALKTFPFKRGGVANISVRVGLTGGIVDKTKFEILPEFLVTEDKPYMWESSVALAVLATMCEELGITNEIVAEYRRRDKPLFLSELTSDQEDEVADVILHGMIPFTGDYGDMLRKIMVTYYNEFMLNNTRVSVVQLPFESYIYNKSERSYTSILSVRREELKLFNVEEIYLTSDTVYYKSDVPHKQESGISRDLIMGMYCNEPTPDLFRGVQGVFVEEGDDTSIPVFLADVGVRYISNNVDFVEGDEIQFLKKYRCNDWEKLYRRIENYTDDEIVQEFVYALLRARCGYTNHEIMSSLSGINDSGMEEYYREAVRIARENYMLYDSLNGGAYK